jgi:hypothetical protein
MSCNLLKKNTLRNVHNIDEITTYNNKFGDKYQNGRINFGIHKIVEYM